MTILITGSRGKTSSQLLPILSSHPNHNASEPLLLTSRHPEIPIPNQTHRPVVKLNYFFPETFSNPFCRDALSTQRKQQHSSLVEKKKDDVEDDDLRDVKAMYLVGIDRVYDASEKIVPFVRLARESGVKRIVVLSAWEVERGEARMMGGVHEEVAGGGGADADCEDGERMVWPEWVVGEFFFFFRSFVFLLG